MEFIDQYKAARRVSTPLLCVRTFDAKSTTNLMLATFSEAELKKSPFIIWDAVNGMSAVNQAGSEELTVILSGNGPLMSVPLIETLRMLASTREEATILLHNSHLQWNTDPAIIQGIWNLRDSFKANGNMLVLYANPGAILPAELTSDVLVLDVPLPTEGELQATVKEMFKSAKLAEPGTDVLSAATNALIGLPAFPAEQATAMCMELERNAKKEITGGTLNTTDLWERKRQIINQTIGLSVHSGKDTLSDIGGIEAAKDFCRSIMTGNRPPKTIIFLDEIEKAFAGNGTDMSGTKTELLGSQLTWMQDRGIVGMLFIGIPGVSKSQLAKSLGGEYNTPVISFDVAGMQAGLVGSSGTNLRSAQKVVDAVSGGQILAIATCNSIGSLPPELLRRFSLATFFFDIPSTREEKDAIWDIHRKKQSIAGGEENPNDEGWTGAEIEQCCRKAYLLNWTLAKAAQSVIPVTRSSKETIETLRETAHGKYLSASKPGAYDKAETVTTRTGVQAPVFAGAAEGRRIRG